MLKSNIISLSNVKLARQYLYDLLAARIDAKGRQWLDAKIEQLVREYSERDFYLSFNLIPRFTGKQPLALNTIEKQKMEKLRDGLDLSHWTVDQVGRNLILLYIPFDDLEFYKNTLKNLFETAGVDELVALYAGLPLSPLGEALNDRASEGIRTNMTAIPGTILTMWPGIRWYSRLFLWKGPSTVSQALKTVTTKNSRG